MLPISCGIIGSIVYYYEIEEWIERLKNIGEIPNEEENKEN